MTQRADGQIPEISQITHTQVLKGDFPPPQAVQWLLALFFDHVMHRVCGTGIRRQRTQLVETIAFYIEHRWAGGCRCCCSESGPLGMVSKLGPELCLPCCRTALIISHSAKHNNGTRVEVAALLGWERSQAGFVNPNDKYTHKALQDFWAGVDFNGLNHSKPLNPIEDHGVHC